MGFSLVVTQRLANAFAEGDDARFAREVGSSLGVVLAAFAFLTAITFVLSPWIPGWINAAANQAAPLRWAIVLAGTGAAAQVVALIPWSVLQAWQLAFLCEFNLLLSCVLGLAATIIALFHGFGVIAFGVGMLATGTSAAALLFCVVAFQWRQRKLQLPRLSARASFTLFKYSSPVIFSRMILSFVNDGQSVIVSACISPTAAAILSLTSRIFTGCRTMLEPIIGCSFAGIANLVGTSELQSARVRSVLQELFTIVGISAAIMLGLGTALNVSFGRLWVGPQRFGGLSLTVVVCIATLAVSTNNILGMILTALGNIRGPAWVSLASVSVPCAIDHRSIALARNCWCTARRHRFLAGNWIVVVISFIPSMPVPQYFRGSARGGRWLAGARCLPLCRCRGSAVILACHDLGLLSLPWRTDGFGAVNADGAVDAICTGQSCAGCNVSVVVARKRIVRIFDVYFFTSAGPTEDMVQAC